MDEHTVLVSYFNHRDDCCYNLKENAIVLRMESRDLATGILFLSQTTVGILGNFSLLYYLVLNYYKCRLRATDLIITHLITANSLIILSQGIPNTMAAFGLTQSFSYVGCSLLLYVHRVGRSVSIGTTCILSVFQVITISPSNSCCKDLKIKVQKYICLSTSLCWIIYLVVNFIFPVYVYIKQNSKNVTKKGRDIVYCFTTGYDATTESLYVALVVCPEVVFSGLIFWSSSSMTVLLYRHKQQVQHIRSTHGSPRAFPETRVTLNILVPVFAFLAFYTLSAVLHAYISFSSGHSWWLIKATTFISLCFPALGPFVLRTHDSPMLRPWFLCIRYTKSCHLKSPHTLGPK